ncbi:deoxyribonuclease V [Pseudomonas sp. PDM14]|uniref:deoxyribonuclease V n=1 Tax=Pseudomonas sp. PDM14 TaxID=2769288 RepID=UPI00177D8E8E|nr:deoxyribonuclease V [Pseudomonas sp. PDM14]MBD9482405.1 deoxyribonuclease V [Pseudomonas sp. PDM14]
MHTSPFTDWDGTAQQARVLQRTLAERVVLEDDFAPLRVIAGVDVGFEEQGRVTLAAAVLLDAESLQLIGHSVARIPTSMPYVPGLLSFRELPALLQALQALPQVPDLIYCDGLGIAHPRRLGIASHLGVVTGLPTIGVAKSILVGSHEELPQEKGARVPLKHTGEQVGWMLRSKDRVKPLIVSPGHRVSLDTAVELVASCCRGYRLPEPTRLADRLASRRGAMPAPLTSTPDLFG